jgi:hypothetical protein
MSVNDLEDWMPPPMPSRWRVIPALLVMTIALAFLVAWSLLRDIWEWLVDFRLHCVYETWCDYVSVARINLLRREWARHHWQSDPARSFLYNTPKCLRDDET